ncbi:MAG: tetratricopeptide repeat protein [Deltaproteobacteria bacterium]|jgi:tetratricopeptide (TPR) repeat protein|nr:tetratricopeptide repeat protein [Deltaproteobacteria bacterium]
MKIKTPFSVKDLTHYQNNFLGELSSFFPTLNLSLKATPDPQSHRNIDLTFQGKQLGVLTVDFPSEGTTPSPDTLESLPKISLSLIEKMAYKKALIRDWESGLYTRDYFLTKLKRLLSHRPEVTRSLQLEEIKNNSFAIAMAEFQTPLANYSPKNYRFLAKSLNSLPGALISGRLTETRLATLTRVQEDVDLRVNLLNILNETPSMGLGPIQIAYAVFPEDLLISETTTYPLMELLDKSSLALNFAKKLTPPASLISFGDILKRFGRITQVLPQERVIINLGRELGARAGQRFTVHSADYTPKGEVLVFETSQAYSLAHVLGSPRAFSQGDLLEFAGTEKTPLVLRNDTEGVYAQALDNLNTFLKEQNRQKPFLLGLARLDDQEKLLALLGEKEVQKKLRFFVESLKQNFPHPPLFSETIEPGTQALVWTPPPPEAHLKLKTFLKSSLGPGKVSMSLVFWPSDILSSETILTAAFNSLFEASMSGQEEAIVFGPQTLNILGDRLFGQGDILGAIQEYRKGLILDPGHINLLNSLGVCHGRLGDHKAAVAAFDDILRLDPKDVMANFNKGSSYLLSGLLEDAEKYLEIAATLDPSNFEILFLLGKTSLELGHTPKALDALTHAAESKGRRGVVYRLLGQARFLSGDNSGAMASFKQAVKFNPDDAQSLASLGVLYRDVNQDNDMALSLLKRSVELDPSNSLFRRRLGKLLYDLGKYQEAERHLRTAIEYSRVIPQSDGIEHLAAALENEDLEIAQNFSGSKENDSLHSS